MIHILLKEAAPDPGRFTSSPAGGLLVDGLRAPRRGDTSPVLSLPSTLGMIARGWCYKRPQRTLDGVTTVEEIVQAVHVDPADVHVVLGWLAADGLDISNPEAVTAVHRILNPHAERTVAGLYFPDDGTGTGRTKMR